MIEWEKAILAGKKMIYERRSIRKYKKDRIPHDDILKMLDAARAAPSAKNRQPWKFIVYEGRQKAYLLDVMETGIRREIKFPMLPGSSFGIEDAKNTLRIMREAPVVICVMDPNGCSPFEDINPDQRFTEINSTLSVGAAVENLILKATELGYGSLWVGNTCFAYQEVFDEIGVDGQLVCAVVLGIAEEHPKARPRKRMEDIAEFRG